MNENLLIFQKKIGNWKKIGKILNFLIFHLILGKNKLFGEANKLFSLFAKKNHGKLGKITFNHWKTFFYKRKS